MQKLAKVAPIFLGICLIPLFLHSYLFGLSKDKPAPVQASASSGNQLATATSEASQLQLSEPALLLVLGAGLIVSASILPRRLLGRGRS
jgi:hypothetical protein